MTLRATSALPSLTCLRGLIRSIPAFGSGSDFRMKFGTSTANLWSSTWNHGAPVLGSRQARPAQLRAGERFAYLGSRRSYGGAPLNVHVGRIGGKIKSSQWVILRMVCRRCTMEHPRKPYIFAGALTRNRRTLKGRMGEGYLLLFLLSRGKCARAVRGSSSA